MLNIKDEVNLELLDVKLPVKVEDKWVLELLYNKEPITFQSPTLRLDSQNKKLFFDATKKKIFFEFIDALETTLLFKISEKSESLFKGKTFSVQQLQEAMVSSLNVSNDLVADFDLSNALQNTVFLSLFGESSTFDKMSKNVVCIFKLDSVHFTKKTFTFNYTISHMKSKKPEKVDVSFEESFEDKVQVHTEIVEQPIEEKPEQLSFF